MTNRIPRPSRDLVFRGLACLAVGGSIAFASGCGQEEEVVAQAPAPRKAPPPPPPPAPPKAESIDSLMQRLQIDPRVSLPEDEAPDTTDQRIAVLRFFDGFARGDASRLDGLMSGADALLLERMVDSGSFEAATTDIMAVKVQTGQDLMGNDCALAVFMMANGDFEAQLWSFEVNGDPAGDGATFDALPSPPNIFERLSGDDWIAAWMAVLAQELARAEEPDEIVEFSTTDLSEDSTTGSPRGNAPIGPGGGAPGRKRPTGPPVDPNPQGPGGPIGR
ncbi:MAG: hypothetical protein CMJ23_01810 [Phycisphaerae bacterium]|nr:hypothetical protein [Phycisphaerae bacterium]